MPTLHKHAGLLENIITGVERALNITINRNVSARAGTEPTPAPEPAESVRRYH